MVTAASPNADIDEMLAGMFQTFLRRHICINSIGRFKMLVGAFRLCNILIFSRGSIGGSADSLGMTLHHALLEEGDNSSSQVLSSRFSVLAFVHQSDFGFLIITVRRPKIQRPKIFNLLKIYVRRTVMCRGGGVRLKKKVWVM